MKSLEKVSILQTSKQLSTVACFGFFFVYGIPRFALPTAKKIVDTFPVSDYNMHAENGYLSACFPMTTTHTTDVAGIHGYNE